MGERGGVELCRTYYNSVELSIQLVILRIQLGTTESSRKLYELGVVSEVI